MNITVRKGKQEDLPRVLELIVELAVYEKAEDQVVNTVEQMEKDGFGEVPLFGFYVVEKNKRIVGLSLYYFRYSTWKGKRLYIEDIIVTEHERNNGYGRLLFEATQQYAKDSGCSGMTWQVLDWNTPAIKFYDQSGAHFDEEWVTCNFDF